MTKRIFDLFVSGLSLILLSPLFILTAIAIRIDSPGPILFRQTRVGRHGRSFRIRKFRTMFVDQRGVASQLTAARDPRITPLGHYLRRSKVDELPQLIDVFLGDMSFVGPRPEVPVYVAFYPSDVKEKVLSVRPGITDACSLKFIDEGELLAKSDDPETFYINEILPQKIGFYLHYIQNRSTCGDISIIIATVLSIFRSRRS